MAATSRLVEMQARFQQKQMLKKEENLLRLYENQQQRVFERVARSSAGSNTSLSSNNGTGGKVRQLFEERRQKAGVDKSYPLQPISNGKITPSSVSVAKPKSKPPVMMVQNQRKSTVQRNVTQVRKNVGNPLSNKQTFQKLYTNNNNDEEDLLDQNNLVELINKSNINNYSNNNLDEEESPSLESGVESQSDVVYLMGKLPNVGGIPPSQKVEEITSPPKRSMNTNTSIAKQPTARKSPTSKLLTVPKENPQTPPPSATTPTSPSNAISSPRHSSQKMTTKTSKSYMNSSPSTNRPSSNQKAPKDAGKNNASAMSVVVRDDLKECNFCGRRFAADRLDKHQDICGKTHKKQRKTYDAFKHRVQGTEIEQFAAPGKKKAGSKTVPKKASSVPVGAAKKNWRRTHEEFIAAIRSAKMAQAHLASGGKLSDLPPPPPSSNPDYVQCPSCGRRFNEAAAQRHIPKCASYEYNKPKPGAAVAKKR